jgi:hypothetical protein
LNREITALKEQNFLKVTIAEHHFFSPFASLWSIGLISQFLDHFTDGRTPWTGDQLVAQTQNKRIHTPNIHALCGILTHDPGFRASEDSSCLRPLGYRDRQNAIRRTEIQKQITNTLYFATA